MNRASTYLYQRPKLILALLLGPPLLYMLVVYLGSLFALLVNSFFYLEEFTGLRYTAFFLGDRTRLFVDAGEAQPLVIETAARRDFAHGEAVGLQIDPRGLLVL